MGFRTWGSEVHGYKQKLLKGGILRGSFEMCISYIYIYLFIYGNMCLLML